jgi:Fur family ferric uptake transcriptional regulator
VTRSPYSPALRYDDLDEVILALRERGHRLSAARRLVLEALFGAEGPVSAEYIADGAAGRVTRSDVTSVYRNLTALEELGVVRHVHIGHGPGLYALTGSGEHEFLACERCDRVTTVEPRALDPVRAQIWKRFGYEARFSHFPILGLCPDCAAGEPQGAEPVSGSASASRRPDTDPHHHEHSHGTYIHSHPHAHGEGEGEGEDHGHSHRHPAGPAIGSGSGK